jgi:beta-lactamase regulating signal transducer with metallopeptidase domain
MVAWIGLGAIASARFVGRTQATPDRLGVILDRVVGEGVRPPRLIICPKLLHPVAVGLIRPSIVLPARFADMEPEGRIEAALAHEWAHIRNGDLWLLAASRLLLPLLFAHPMYAGLRRRMRADQEALADAEAGAREGRIAYAEALLCWSRAGGDRVPNTFAPSLGLWGRSSSLARRVALLLDRDFRVEPACPRPWRMGVCGVSAALIMVLGLASMNDSAGLSLASSRTMHPLSRGGPHVHAHGAATTSLSSLEESPALACPCRD